jgi:hypothetical protein
MTAQETVVRYYDAWKRKNGDFSDVPLAEDRIGGDGDTVCSIVEWDMATPGAGPMTAAEVLEVRGGRVAVKAAPLAVGYVERAAFRAYEVRRQPAEVLARAQGVGVRPTRCGWPSADVVAAISSARASSRRRLANRIGTLPPPGRRGSQPAPELNLPASAPPRSSIQRTAESHMCCSSLPSTSCRSIGTAASRAGRRLCALSACDTRARCGRQQSQRSRQPTRR